MKSEYDSDNPVRMGTITLRRTERSGRYSLAGNRIYDEMFKDDYEEEYRDDDRADDENAMGVQASLTIVPG
jgi:hypothetical protein